VYSLLHKKIKKLYEENKKLGYFFIKVMLKLNHSNMIILIVLRKHIVNYLTPIRINYSFGYVLRTGVFLIENKYFRSIF